MKRSYLLGLFELSMILHDLEIGFFCAVELQQFKSKGNEVHRSSKCNFNYSKTQKQFLGATIKYIYRKTFNRTIQKKNDCQTYLHQRSGHPQTLKLLVLTLKIVYNKGRFHRAIYKNSQSD